MNLLDFTARFATEESCANYMKEKREEEGIICKKCGHTKHYWYEKMQLWKCAYCGTRLNLRSGTIMEKSHIPIRMWFMVLHFMTSTKKSFSALEMQRQLGWHYYEPIWYMMQKIRVTMGNRDAKYKLKGNIEIDDAFYEVVNIPEKDLNGDKITPSETKRGRGSEKQAKVLVMVESTPKFDQTNPHKKNRVMGFAKMIVMDDLKSVAINYEVNKAVDPTSIMISDGYRAYADLIKVVNSHKALVVPQKEAHKILPWVHTVIANSKRQFLGVHHSIGRDYLQNYLNEFIYKLNRRNFKDDLFDRLIVAGIKDSWH